MIPLGAVGSSHETASDDDPRGACVKLVTTPGTDVTRHTKRYFLLFILVLFLQDARLKMFNCAKTIEHKAHICS